MEKSPFSLSLHVGSMVRDFCLGLELEIEEIGHTKPLGYGILQIVVTIGIFPSLKWSISQFAGYVADDWMSIHPQR